MNLYDAIRMRRHIESAAGYQSNEEALVYMAGKKNN